VLTVTPFFNHFLRSAFEKPAMPALAAE